MNDQLIRKLRLPQEGKILVLNPPDNYLLELGLTEEVTRVQEQEQDCDFVQVFVRSIQEVEQLAGAALHAVKKDGLLWFCYLKGGAKAGTDLNRDKGWETLTQAGYEGVSLVSVDDKWSAMRYRPVGAGGTTRRSRAASSVQREGTGTAGTSEAVPEDLQDQLDLSPEASRFFGTLAPSHRKAYIQWIEEAKRAETRVSRVTKTIEKLTQGLKRPTDKP